MLRHPLIKPDSETIEWQLSDKPILSLAVSNGHKHAL